MKISATFLAVTTLTSVEGRYLRSLAQGETDTTHNCYTREVWSADKKTWCCDNAKLGCDGVKGQAALPSGPATYPALPSDPAMKACWGAGNVWFDGCNNCGAGGACTMIFCETMGEAKCMDGNKADPVREIEDATSSWAKAVTVKNNPEKVVNHFCSDGILWGTDSKSLRTTPETIDDYFQYFAKIPGITLKEAVMNVAKVTNDVYVNNVLSTITDDSLDEPRVARMTFIFRRDSDQWCIFELHSSGLPEMNEGLKAIDNANAEDEGKDEDKDEAKDGDKDEDKDDEDKKKKGSSSYNN